MYLICFVYTELIIFMLRQLKLEVQLIDFMPPLCGRHQHRTYSQVIIMASHVLTSSSFLWVGGSSSNWTLMSCQPHRVTSGQSNSGHKQIHISKLFSYISTLCQVYLQNQSLHKHKTSQTQIFEELVPSVLPLLKEHIRHTCWYRRPFRLIYRYQVKEKYI